MLLWCLLPTWVAHTISKDSWARTSPPKVEPFSNFFQNNSPYQRELWEDMHCQGGMSKPRGVLCTLPKGIKMQLVPKAEFQTLLIYPQLQIIQVALDNIKINTVQMSSNLANCKSKDICANLFYSICFCTSVVISDQASTFSSALHLTTWIWTMPEVAPRTHKNHFWESVPQT